MLQVNDVVWTIDSPFEPPKKCVITHVKRAARGYSYAIYNLKTDDNEFERDCNEIFRCPKEAEITWAIDFQKLYHSIKENSDAYVMEDYDASFEVSKQILKKYMFNSPNLILKCI